MIDPVLKKFGLSEARKSIRNMNNSEMSAKTPRKNSSNLTSKVFNKTSQVSETFQQQISQKTPSTIIQKLLSLLSSQLNLPCKNHNHHINKIKFVCLDDACSQNFGCAECFIYYHKNHPKAEIKTCIRQMTQLQKFMKDSYETILSKKTLLKSQFIKQIQLEIDHMCDEFHRSLQFMKNKAIKQIDDHLFQKYEGLEILNSYRNQKQITQYELIGELITIDIKQIQQNMQRQLKQLSYQKMKLRPVVKFFQEMNGTLGNFMSEFKKCFPKIYPSNDFQFSDPAFLGNLSLKEKQYLTSQFKPSQSQNSHQKEDSPYQENQEYTLGASKSISS